MYRLVISEVLCVTDTKRTCTAWLSVRCCVWQIPRGHVPSGYQWGVVCETDTKRTCTVWWSVRCCVWDRYQEDMYRLVISEVLCVRQISRGHVPSGDQWGVVCETDTKRTCTIWWSVKCCVWQIPRGHVPSGYQWGVVCETDTKRTCTVWWSVRCCVWDRYQEGMYRLVISEVLCVTETKRTCTVWWSVRCCVWDRYQEHMYRLVISEVLCVWQRPRGHVPSGDQWGVVCDRDQEDMYRLVISDVLCVWQIPRGHVPSGDQWRVVCEADTKRTCTVWWSVTCCVCDRYQEDMYRLVISEVLCVWQIPRGHIPSGDQWGVCVTDTKSTCTVWWSVRCCVWDRYQEDMYRLVISEVLCVWQIPRGHVPSGDQWGVCVWQRPRGHVPSGDQWGVVCETDTKRTCTIWWSVRCCVCDRDQEDMYRLVISEVLCMWQRPRGHVPSVISEVLCVTKTKRTCTVCDQWGVVCVTETKRTCTVCDQWGVVCVTETKRTCTVCDQWGVVCVTETKRTCTVWWSVKCCVWQRPRGHVPSVISEMLCVTETKRTCTVCDQWGVVCDRDQEDMYRLWPVRCCVWQRPRGHVPSVISEVLCVTETKRTCTVCDQWGIVYVTETKRTCTVCDQWGVVCDRDQEDMYRLWSVRYCVCDRDQEDMYPLWSVRYCVCDRDQEDMYRLWSVRYCVCDRDQEDMYRLWSVRCCVCDRDQEDMYRLVISNYEEKQKELMEENSDLRQCLSDMQKELHALLGMRTNRTRVIWCPLSSLSIITILFNYTFIYLKCSQLLKNYKF